MSKELATERGGGIMSTGSLMFCSNHTQRKVTKKPQVAHSHKTELEPIQYLLHCIVEGIME